VAVKVFPLAPVNVITALANGAPTEAVPVNVLAAGTLAVLPTPPPPPPPHASKVATADAVSRNLIALNMIAYLSMRKPISLAYFRLACNHFRPNSFLIDIDTLPFALLRGNVNIFFCLFP
jgi:hypothetical protein